MRGSALVLFGSRFYHVMVTLALRAQALLEDERYDKAMLAFEQVHDRRAMPWGHVTITQRSRAWRDEITYAIVAGLLRHNPQTKTPLSDNQTLSRAGDRYWTSD